MSESDLILTLIIVGVLWGPLALWRQPYEPRRQTCPNGVIGCQGWGAGKPEPCEQCHYDSFV